MPIDREVFGYATADAVYDPKTDSWLVGVRIPTALMDATGRLIAGPVAPGTAVYMEDGRQVGTITEPIPEGRHRLKF